MDTTTLLVIVLLVVLLGGEHVVPRQRHGFQSLRKRHLEHHYPPCRNPMNFDVGREQSRLLNRCHDLRQSRNIGPWEDVLADEGMDRRGLAEASDGMEQANA